MREIDALGGIMGKAADKNMLQSRMLNLGKGPAVHSLRAQIDRRDYSAYMKHTLEKQPNLDVKQAEVIKLWKEDDGWHFTTRLGAEYVSKTVILATGTFLGGRIYVGEVNYESGPDGTFAATELSKSLYKLNLPLRRFKTGTPARALKSSIDFSQMEVQEGDEKIVPFSYSTTEEGENRVVCHIAYTGEETKKIILDNLHRSPLFSGEIKGAGPRYCPSIEDKIVRFADKERHQIFVEPCGLNTEEMYLQGMSSSLPEEVQLAIYRSVKGMENIKIMRNAYAIEYDCIDPTALYHTLEVKDCEGLYGAGQFNGSSGYEEAAAQGFVAGVNAAHKVLSREPLVLDRAGSYIGTLIDDLVTKGCSDPYRMMTSRSEYRLLLRQDNADERMMPTGRAIGLVTDEEWEAYLKRESQKEAEIARLGATGIAPSSELNEFLEQSGTSALVTGTKLADLLRRPQISYEALARFDNARPELPDSVKTAVETEIKYEGYIQKQKAKVREMRRLESRIIPESIDYDAIKGLRLEAKEKLKKIRPQSLGQASRISGVSPADISVLIIYTGEREKND